MRLLIFICLVLLSCERKDNKIKGSKDLNYINNLKKEIVKFGKNEDYFELENYYLYHPEVSPEMLSYTLIMINKFKKKEFYYKVYANYVCLKNNGVFVPYYFSKFEKNEKEFVLYYLMKGFENKDLNSAYELRYIYANDSILKKDKEFMKILDKEILAGNNKIKSN